MERSPDDIFRVHDLSVLKSPMPTHIFNNSPGGQRVTTTPKTPFSVSKGGTSPVVNIVKPTPKPSTFALGLSSLPKSAGGGGGGGTFATPNHTFTPVGRGESRKDLKWSPLGGGVVVTKLEDNLKKEIEEEETENKESKVNEKRVPSPNKKKNNIKQVEQEAKVETEDENIPTSITDTHPNQTKTTKTRIKETITAAPTPQNIFISPSTPTNTTSTSISRKSVVSRGGGGKDSLSSNKTGAEISISMWSLVVVPNNPSVTKVSKSTTEDWIVLVGRRRDMAEMWHSSLITGRHNSRELTTSSGRIYRLEGAPDEEAFRNAGFSEATLKSFLNGFPLNWQQVILEDFASQKEPLPIPQKEVEEQEEGEEEVDTVTEPSPSPQEEEEEQIEPSKVEQVINQAINEIEKEIAEEHSISPIKRKRGRPKKSDELKQQSVLLLDSEEDSQNNNNKISINRTTDEDEEEDNIYKESSSSSANTNNFMDERRTSPPKARFKKKMKKSVVAVCEEENEETTETSSTSPVLKSAKRKRLAVAESTIPDPTVKIDSFTFTDSVTILGQTRSGRRVVAPLPYWENKYIRNGTIVLASSPLPPHKRTPKS